MSFRLANIDGRAALVNDADQWFDLQTLSGGSASSDPMVALTQPDVLHSLAAQMKTAEASGSFTEVISAGLVYAPVPRPRNSFAIGLNYADHAAESTMELPENPLTFTKFPSCIVGPTANVELRSAFADYEAELVVVIGTGGRDIAEADAWNHVLGLTAGQDVSDRVLQFAAKPPHFDLGKSRDTYGPMGPVLVSTDLFADKNAIKVQCWVNGELRQDSTTASLIFTIPKLISYLSSVVTLQTGDVIFSGTPSGVGAARGIFLVPGDIITTTIENIGTLTNHCIA
jgi:2,4-didehydro-3-deoxy-L-rhamnonate hydrolase